MPPLHRILLPAALLFLLSGCFESEAPLLDMATAETPLPDAFRAERGEETFMVAREEDTYRATNDEGETVIYSIFDIGLPNSTLLVQAESEEGTGYYFARLDAYHSEIEFFVPSHDEAVLRELEQAGIDFDLAEDRYPYARFSDAEDLTRAMTIAYRHLGPGIRYQVAPPASGPREYPQGKTGHPTGS